VTDTFMLRKAVEAAVEHSEDPRTQNGAALLLDSGRWLTAANWLPLGVESRPERLEPPEKYRWIEHAERAVILKAAACGARTRDSVLYCPWFACVDCARAIIAAEVREVVGHVVTRQATPERWETEIQFAEAMLREAKIGIRWLAEPLGVTIRFDGKELEL
jgi:dCMP deaminase